MNTEDFFHYLNIVRRDSPALPNNSLRAQISQFRFAQAKDR